MDTLILGLLAAVGGVLATTFWQKLSAARKVLAQGGQQFEQQRQRLQHLENKAAQTEQLQKTLKEQEKEQKQKARSLDSKIQTLEKEVATKESEFQAKLRNIELQRDHLLKQADQTTDKIMLLQQQLTDALETKGTAEVEVIRLRREAKNDQSKNEIDTLRGRIFSLEKELELKNHELKETEKKLAESSPEKMTQLKKKAAHYERLFVSMRSLREMSDERSANWETALKKLSQWALREKGRHTPEQDNTSLGALVGEALEAIGSSLIDPKDDIPPPDVGSAAPDAHA